VPLRPRSEISVTAVVKKRPVGALSVVALLAVAAAVVVHVFVMPLEVLVVWWQPVVLGVSTEPEISAAVTLDGRALPSRSPLRTEVERDRRDHEVEARAPGYEPARARVRFDRDVAVEVVLTLRKQRSAGPAIVLLPGATPVPAPPPHDAGGTSAPAASTDAGAVAPGAASAAPAAPSPSAAAQ